MENVLSVENLSARFVTNNGNVSVLENISFSLKKGEMLGLIGESGCGKTTLALCILRILEYPGEIFSGKVLLNGEDLLKVSRSRLEEVRWKEISIIPQNAMNALNPVHTVGNQIVESILAHESIPKKEAQQRARELLELVGIEGSRWNNYPHEFSGGMKQRVAIAMALSCNPQLVIADESTTGLDVLTEAQVIGLIKNLRKELGLSVMMISHDLQMVMTVCDRIVIMYAGHIVEWADTKDFSENTRHPYSISLLKASPDLKNPGKKIVSIPGHVPNLGNPPPGCRFEPRCQYTMERCQQKVPEMREVGMSHYAACFLEN